MTPLVTWHGWIAGSSAALYGLHCLGSWLDDRGWLYYRRSSRKGRWGLAIAAVFDQEVRRILEMQERVQVEHDEDGDPLRPRVRLEVTPGDGETPGEPRGQRVLRGGAVIPSVPSRFEGGCACGGLRYQCSSAPVSIVNCHCRDCQRAGGAGYSPTVVMSRAAFRITQGEPKVFESSVESGNTARRAFCAACGSPLFASSSARAEFLGIRAGSLDDPSWFRATADVWAESAQPWDAMDPTTPKLPRNLRRE